METFVYRPKGVCSREMRFEMDGDIIRNVTIVGGCAGNLLGISRIIKDKKIHKIEMNNMSTEQLSELMRMKLLEENNGE